MKKLKFSWIVPNSGHVTLTEHKDEFNKIVDDFFTNPFHPGEKLYYILSKLFIHINKLYQSFL